MCEIEFPGIFRKREKDPFFSHFFAYLPLIKIVGEGEKKKALIAEMNVMPCDKDNRAVTKGLR